MQTSVVISDKGFPGINPVQFGFENCEKAHSFGPAVRTHWLLHYVVSGYGKYKIQGKNHEISPGDIFVIPPYEETYYEANDKNPWSYIWIGFTADCSLPKRLSPVVHCPEAEAIFENMKSCSEYLGKSEFLCARLWDLFALLSGKESKKGDYVQAALEYIHSEYMHKITVGKIATVLNLERTYFSALFKRKTGVSPKRYITEYRLKIAATLIAEKGISVAVAGNSVGYSDEFAFSKIFKKIFGVSPTAYKKSHRHPST